MSDVVEFMLSDGRGVAVEPAMVDNAECFVHDHKLFKSDLKFNKAILHKKSS